MNKILLIGPLPPPYYGQSISFEMLVAYVQKNNSNTHVIDYSSRYDKPGRGFSLKRSFEYLYIFLLVIKYFVKNPDNSIAYLTISQSFSGFFRDFVFILLSSLFKNRIILHLKGGNYENFYYQRNLIMKKLIKYTLRKADKIVVLGRSLVSMFDFDPLLKDKIEVIHNGLPFSLPTIKRSNNNFNILFLSNMIYSKGYFHLLEALHILNKQGLKFVANFCGDFLVSPDDTENMNELQLKNFFLEHISKYHLDSCVNYLGVVNGDKKNQLLANADIFVLPTNYINEGQPVSIIEAMAFETAILSTKFRSIVDMIDEGVEGLFVEYGNPQSIAMEIRKLMTNSDLLELMKSSSKKRFLKDFSQTTHLKRMGQLFLQE